MDDHTSVGRSVEFGDARARAIGSAIDGTSKAFALGSAVAHAQILSDFIREGAARLAELKATRPDLFSEEGGWALGATRRACAELASTLQSLEGLLSLYADEKAPSWEAARSSEIAQRSCAMEFDREFLEILRINIYARRYMEADDDYRAHLLQQAVSDIAREFFGAYIHAADLEKIRLTMAARVNRAPPSKHLAANTIAWTPEEYPDGYDDDGYDD
ncbi:MAG: hypothetical protein Q7S93_11435 [Phenylobacterium sp.]|nr:hypothetical protein [Phenylobacterium sp.]